MLITPTHRDDVDALERATPQYGTRKGDLGSWPTERVTLLSVFREGCEEWHRHGRDGHCGPARQAVLMTLKDRYDAEHLARWWGNIKSILDRAEAEIMEVGQCLKD